VYPDVQPQVTFADPINDGIPGASPADIAAKFVRLDDAAGNPVDADVSVAGGSIRLAPTKALEPGQRYTFRVLPGLPFVSGGELDAERRSELTVARPAVGEWPDAMQLTVTVPSPMGGTSPMPFVLRKLPSTPGVARVEIQPIVFGKQQRQTVWLRVDGDKLYLQAFALPIAPTAVADASGIVGTVTATDGVITSASGTLRITGPGIDLPNISFTIAPPAPPPQTVVSTSPN
jgi:hypothetical protein